MVRAPRKKSRKQDLREDTVVTLYARARMLYEEHRKWVLGIVGGVLALLLLGMAYSYYTQQQEEKARELLGPVIRLYEMGQYQQALEGSPDHPGLLEIIEEYGGTKAGNLARYYAGDAYYRMGEKEKALEYFESFKKEPTLLGAAAYAAEAAIYEDMGKYEQAAKYYEKAATIYENPALSPDYLMKAARNYAKAGQFEKARRMYELIRERYPESGYGQAIDLYLTQLEAMERSARKQP